MGPATYLLELDIGVNHRTGFVFCFNMSQFHAALLLDVLNTRVVSTNGVYFAQQLWIGP